MSFFAVSGVDFAGGGAVVLPAVDGVVLLFVESVLKLQAKAAVNRIVATKRSMTKVFDLITLVLLD
jgi:hypothetical protein